LIKCKIVQSKLIFNKILTFMIVVFKNEIKNKYEIGIIIKSYKTQYGKKYDLISEAGTHHSALSTNIKKLSHINEHLTEKIIPKIKTNLTKFNQANYSDPEFIPNILKIDI
jgi:hypothetical protein